MNETAQNILMAPLFLGFVVIWIWWARRLRPDAPMSRLDRLVLDAVEESGPDAEVMNHIWPYVRARRWMPIPTVLHFSLIRLEMAGEITSEWASRPSPATLLYPRTRVYSVAGERGR